VKEAVRRYIHEKKLKHQNHLLKNINAKLEIKVKERTSELEAQKAELKKLNSSKDQFFSIIAHDLRTPFAGLLSTTEAILQNIDQIGFREVKENLQALKHSAETVYTLLENLLAWSRLQRGMMEHKPEAIMLSEIAERNTRLFTSTAQRKQITLTNQIFQNMQAYADKHMIDTVMRNLISNAIKFTPFGGVIALSSIHYKTSVGFSVSDTGVGIPRDVVPQIFRIDEKYSNPGTAGEEGTGLGLPLCKDLIDKNNGSITIESELDQGTIFSVYLPSVTIET
jgi:signal transduction histidine kinase